MNRVLKAINDEHGFRGEWLTDHEGEIMIYQDEIFEGRFVPDSKVYRFHPVTAARLDLNTMSRIRGALAKANKARFREML